MLIQNNRDYMKDILKKGLTLKVNSFMYEVFKKNFAGVA